MKSRDKSKLNRLIVHTLQAIPLFFFYGVFACMPVRMGSALGGWLGRTLGPKLGASKRIYRNLRYIWPQMTRTTQQTIVTQMWDNLGRMIAEAPHLKKLSLGPSLVTEGAEHLEQARQEQRPIIFLGGHFANWEMTPFATTLHGFPTSVIYRKPNNPFADWLIRHIRKQNTHNLLPKGTQGARGLLRELNAGRSVGVLIDQKMNDGVSIPFMGKPAMTAHIPFGLALKTNAVLIPIQTLRTSKGPTFKVIFHPALRPNKALDDEAQIHSWAQQTNSLLGQWVEQDPEHWLWLHRRWGRI